MLWDTAGQEEFDAITAAYYRGAHACVLAFSATDRDSFDAIPSWKLKVCHLLLDLHRTTAVSLGGPSIRLLNMRTSDVNDGFQ